jgi:cellulose 1,4-beta-cellobiosidase
VPLSTSTSLFTLGILAKGTVTVNDGTNTTTYQSTGSDTVGDLINAINKNVYGHAQVTAGLNASGKLTLTANNQTATIQVGGSYAANVGFGASNNFFQPITPTAATGSSSSTSSGSSSTSGSGGTKTSSSSSATASTSAAKTSTSSAAAGRLNSALQLQTGGTAEILLASSGISGSLVNLLA